MKSTIKINSNLIFPLCASILLLIVKQYVHISTPWYVSIVVLSYPFKIGRTVISLFGGTNTVGNVYSLISFYQKTEEDAYAFITLGLQLSRNKAVHFAGIAYQHAYESTVQWFGIAWQISDNEDTVQVVGITYQNAGMSCLNILGIAYQISQEETNQWIGIAFQIAESETYQGVGLTPYRKGKIFRGKGIYLFQHQIAEVIHHQI